MRFSMLFFVFSGLYFVFLGALGVSSKNPMHWKRHFIHSYRHGDLVGIRVMKKTSENPQRIGFEAEVVSVGNRSTGGKVYLAIPRGSEARSIRTGDILITKSAVREISSTVNPGAFNFRAFAEKRRMHHQVYLSEGKYLRRTGRKYGIWRISHQVNERFQRALERGLQEPEALGVAKALLLGYRLEISQDLLEEYKGAGAMHLLAISGLHAGIVLTIVLGVTRGIRRVRGGKKLQLLFSILLLWCFALVSGFAASVVRSVSMFSLLALGRVLNRNTSLWSNLVTSAFFLLLVKPMYLFDVGFQLSYSALFGIACAVPLLGKIKYRSRIVKYFVGLAIVSCAAQTGVMPLGLFYFNQFSGLFLISSLSLIPAIGITLILGYAVMFIALFSEPFDIPTQIFETWIKLLNGADKGISALEPMIFRDVYFPVHFSLLAYLALVLLFWGIIKKKSILVFLFGAVLLAMQFFWLKQRSETLKTEELVIFHLWKDSLVVKRRGKELILLQTFRDSLKQQRVLREYTRTMPGSFVLKRHAGEEDKEADRRRRICSVDSTVIAFIDGSFDWREKEIKYLGAEPLRSGLRVLVLMRSPRLNLDRILRETRPRTVVADGSNYPSFIRRWKKTCAANGTEFYATSELGAFAYPALE